MGLEHLIWGLSHTLGVQPDRVSVSVIVIIGSNGLKAHDTVPSPFGECVASSEIK